MIGANLYVCLDMLKICSMVNDNSRQYMFCFQRLRFTLKSFHPTYCKDVRLTTSMSEIPLPLVLSPLDADVVGYDSAKLRWSNRNVLWIPSCQALYKGTWKFAAAHVTLTQDYLFPNPSQHHLPQQIWSTGLCTHRELPRRHHGLRRVQHRSIPDICQKYSQGCHP